MLKTKDSVVRSRRLPHIVATSLLLVIVGAFAADAGPARPAPSLPPPTGAIVNVSTESQLQAAMGGMTSNMTIVLAPGTYRLTRSLYFTGALTNIAIRGATGSSDDVVIIGPGMTVYADIPYGIWTGNGVNGITIADMTIRDFYFHPIVFIGGTQRPFVHNVHLIDAGQQFIKSNPDASGIGASDGIVEYSIFEFTTTARDDYPKGIDVHGGANWKIRHNLFRNLQAPAGQLIGPAVLVWRGSSNTVTEGNTFLNCGRGIMYGAEDAPGFGHQGGVIRNNFFYRPSSNYGDVGIQVADSPDTQVVNNTILLSGTYRAAIEYRFSGASGLVIANNLVDAGLWAREGATATLMANVVDATPDLFVNAAAGDLHLRSTATRAIEQGIAMSAVTTDWDADSRGTAVDIGADEYVPPAVFYRIGGRVMSTATQLPITGAGVSLQGASSKALTTGTDGGYVFEGLSSGDYAVTVAAAGYTFAQSTRYYYPLTASESADFWGTPTPPVNNPPVNNPPTVTLSASSVSVVAGARVTLTAAASDPDGGVTGVSFYVDQRLVGTDASSPYSFAWKPAKAGHYSLTAVATDAAGSTAVSQPVVVTVTSKPRR